MSKRTLQPHSHFKNDFDTPPDKRQRVSQNGATKTQLQNHIQHTTNADATCQPNCNETELQDIDVIPKIVFVSGNNFKVQEVLSFFDHDAKYNISQLKTNKKLEIPEIQGTPKQIITAKLFEAKQYVDDNTSLLVHDTSLVLNAFAKPNSTQLQLQLKHQSHSNDTIAIATCTSNSNSQSNYNTDTDKQNSYDNCNSNSNSNSNSVKSTNKDDIKCGINDDAYEYLGFPGPYIKHLLEWDSDGNEALCKMVCGLKDNSCYALGIYGYLEANSNTPQFFVGKCDGFVPNKPINGKYKSIAWDNVFIPKGQKNGEMKTFAQMPMKEKITYSQNLKALKKFKQYLDRQRK